MSTLVTVSTGSAVVIIRCDGIDQDPIIPGNVRLAYTYDLLTQDAEGKAWDTDVWSIPKSQVVSYARGKPYQEPQPEPEPVPEAEPVPELTPEQQARAARRRAELREADRMLLEMARAKLDAAEPSPAAEDPMAETPPTEPAPVPRKRLRAKRPGRGQKKPA